MLRSQLRSNSLISAYGTVTNWLPQKKYIINEDTTTSPDATTVKIAYHRYCLKVHPWEHRFVIMRGCSRNKHLKEFGGTDMESY
jgi:hypothetical protein